MGAPFNQWLSMSQSCRAYSSARQSARQSVVELRYSAVWLTCFSHLIYATRACTRAAVCPLNPPRSFIAYTQHFSLQSATLVSQRRCIGASQLATTDHEPSSSPHRTRSNSHTLAVRPEPSRARLTRYCKHT